MADLASLLGLDEPSYQEQAQAMAAALRRQQAAGMLASLSGDRVLGQFGHGLQQDAQQGQTQLAAMPGQRLRMAIEREQLQRQQAQNAAQTDPATARVLKQALQSMGVDPGEASPQVLQQILPVAEKKYAADQSVAARRDALAQQRELRQERQQQHDDEKSDKQFVDFGNALNLARGRQGEAGKAMGTLQQIARDDVLAKVNGGNLSPQQMYELARGLDRSISGAAPTIGATEHLVPKTWRGSLAEFQQWFDSQPHGAGQQAFVKQVQDTLDRLKGATQGFVNDTNAKTVQAYSHLSKKNLDRFVAAIRGAGLNPDDFDRTTWLYQPKGAAPQASASEDAEAIAWAKANPQDPRAAQILKLHGVQ